MGMLLARHSSMQWARVMPGIWYLVVAVQTSPSRTMKKLTLLHVATNPWGSSISPSSAPALFAYRQELMVRCLQQACCCCSM